MQLARWAFNIRQPLLLENIEPLVTSLTDVNDGRRVIVPVSNLLNYLPKSETDILLQHRLEDDMRRALIARLMIHAFFTAYYDCQWDELVFDNSEGTKPVLVSPEHLKNVSFNISHHGDWAILVGETEASADGSLRLGVDVVDFQEQVPGESFETFSSCFQDQFTPKEMKFMTDASSPSRSETQLKRFYRLWCLKESMIKALDVSSDFDLKTIEFTIQDNEETEKVK
ncbi:hypothetical protein BGZ98_004765 [Dissophora globulifera]|nr:hypothetical protein BGZ98_004765 [Dissophora globulifera]